MIFVTGASQNHYKSLRNLLRSFFSFQHNATTEITVYNLGLDTISCIDISRF